MANVLYPKFKQALLGAGVNLAAGTVRAQLVDSGTYTYAATHQYITSVPSAARIGGPVTLTSKTIVNGVLDADDATFAAVPAGSGTAATIEALLIYRDSGTEGTSELVAYFDTGVTGLPVIPNGGDIAVQWPALGIFAL